MTLKKFVFAAVLLLIATASFADENAYRFRASYTTDHFEFAGLGGTHWKWLTYKCAGDNCEVNIDTTGVGPGSTDLAITHVNDQTLRVRCLRDGGCRLVITSDSVRIDKTLNRGAVTDFASGSLVSFTASTRPSSSENH